MIPTLFRRALLAALVLSTVCAHAEVEPPVTRLEPGLVLSWQTTAGNSYQLQTRPSTGAPWENSGGTIAGTGSAYSAFHVDDLPTRSFQVVETYTVSVPAPAVILNGGFESGAGSAATDWQTAASQPPVRIDTDAHTGTFSMRARIQNVGSSPAEGILQQTILPAGSAVTPGASYTFSFKAKQIAVGPSYIQQYWLQWLNSSGGIIGGTGLQNFNGTIGQWITVTVGSQTAPAGTAGVKVMFRFVTGAVAGGNGEVLIDEVSLLPSSGAQTTTTETRILNVDTSRAGRMSWTGLAGARYMGELSPDLTNWTQLPPEQTGDGGMLSFIAPMTRTADFLRVVMTGLPPEPGSGPVPLFSSATALEPSVLVDTTASLTTYLADRVRDRHAREAIYNSYDHYLPFYWEQRVSSMEIIDEVAKGGNRIVFNYTTLAPLNPAEFRAFFLGRNTVAEYHYNAIAPLVSSGPSTRHPGETDYNYSIALQNKLPENRPLAIGDRVEIEISFFLGSVRNGRLNYYGTTFLYIVGEGIVPWYQENEYIPGGSIDSRRLPETAWLGGRGTLPYQYSNEPEHRFKQMVGNMAPVNAEPFMLGRRLHHTDFETGAHSEAGNPAMLVHQGKVGPKFIARSCVDCHGNNGRALPPAVGGQLIQSVVKVAADSSGAPHPTLGEEIQPFATSGGGEGAVTLASYALTQGTYGDGSPYTLRKPVYSFSGTAPAHFSVRIAPQLVGLGLLEAVPEAAVAALSDPDDTNADGISGRMQLVPDPEDPATLRLGRFTYKAAQPKVIHQVAYALNRDMGVATNLFPVLDGGTVPVPAELTDAEVDQMGRYVKLLGVGARRDLSDLVAQRGEQVFQSLNCTACHTPSFTTSPHHPLAELRSQTIRPYTDLLLHDMGPGLADNLGEEGAAGSEWRTAPLWNIGLTSGVSGGEAYLHDGRAATLEEAILWHGGEAEASKEAFRNAPASDRQALIKFLRSL